VIVGADDPDDSAWQPANLTTCEGTLMPVYYVIIVSIYWETLLPKNRPKTGKKQDR
jgi:hypothetical protein